MPGDIINRTRQSVAIARGHWLPALLVVLSNSTLHMQAGAESDWIAYSGNIITFTLELGPIFLLLWCADRFSARSAWGIRILSLAAGPAVLLLWPNMFPSMAVYVTSGPLALLVLWLVYIPYLASRGSAGNGLSTLNLKLSLDTVLFSLVVATSFLSALVVNSHEGGMLNQPVPLAVDAARNLKKLPALALLWVQFFLTYMCLYALYYLNHHLLINRILNEHGLLVYVFAGLTALLLLSPLFSYIVISLPISAGSETMAASGNRDVFSAANFFAGLIVLAVSLPLILAFQWQEKTRHLSELKTERLHAELLWLQQQINPHFLFNALNNLYALVLTKSAKAPDAILQLSDLFRYVVYKGSKTRVPLSDEFGYLRDFMALQRLRVRDRCKLEVEFDEETGSYLLAPLLLIVFVENAFKHGFAAQEGDAWIRISAKVDAGVLIFRCDNSLLTTPPATDTGIGLENVRKRLALQYENRHKLQIEKLSDRFSVTLSLELDT